MPEKEVAILCPSYLKPGGCATFIDSVHKTTDRADIFVMCDPNDPHIKEYDDLGAASFSLREPGEEFPQCIQRLWKQNPGYKYYMWGSDDLVMQPGWLEPLLSAMDQYPDNVVVTWPDDGRHGLARHPIAGAAFIEALGWFAYPKLRHSYVDNIITDLSRRLGRLGCSMDSKIEHRHNPSITVPWTPDVEDKEHDKYMDWFLNEQEGDVEKLLARISASSPTL